MEIIPAIDIREGRCVRLYQGDYRQETIYSESPLNVASKFVELGAKWLHIVDLDGARAGTPINIDLVQNIASSTNISIQCGGGIRTIEMAKTILSTGIKRIIIGSAAAEENLKLIKVTCKTLGPDIVMISVDTRNGYLVTRGWEHTTSLHETDLVKRIEETGIQRLIYTDVSRDGTLTEPNFEAIEKLTGHATLKVQAAGGISSVDHLARLAKMGVDGAIVGKAIYTGDIDLRQAIDTVSNII